MSGCAIRRWGTGTPCVKDSTPAAKELSSALASIKAARDQQDAMWHVPIPDAPIMALNTPNENKKTPNRDAKLQ